MSKAAKLAISIAAALLLAVLIVVIPGTREPRYKGLTMRQWLNSKDAQAEEALLVLGTNNLPLLLERIDYDVRRDLPAHFFYRLYRLTRLRMLYDSTWRRNGVAEDALQVFCRLGPKAAPVIPQLTKIAERNEGATPRVLRALSATGDQGLAVVASKTTVWNPFEIRYQAVELLTSHTQSAVSRAALTNVALKEPAAAIRLTAWHSITNR